MFCLSTKAPEIISLVHLLESACSQFWKQPLVMSKRAPISLQVQCQTKHTWDLYFLCRDPSLITIATGLTSDTVCGWLRRQVQLKCILSSAPSEYRGSTQFFYAPFQWNKRQGAAGLLQRLFKMQLKKLSIYHWFLNKGLILPFALYVLHFHIFTAHLEYSNRF